MNRKVFLLGECMVELRKGEQGLLEQSFAGDTYNTAVYLKRCFNAIDVSYITAIGQDALSEELLELIEGEGIDSQFIYRDERYIPGLYLIQTDEAGERSFTYWRDNSAARHVMKFIQGDELNSIVAGDMFFFSGISLAVIKPEDRELLWRKLAYLKEQGVNIVFDPNYRPRMWENPEQAQQAFAKAYSLSSVMLPGIDDFESLYEINTVSGIIDFCAPFDIHELVIKNGSGSVVTLIGNQQQEHKITPVSHVVDTTSAGDAFNGTYLGARLNDSTPEQAVSSAAKAAGFVIQHKGAIVPQREFNQFLQGNKMS